MISTVIAVIRNSGKFHSEAFSKPLGRWAVGRSAPQTEYWANWSSADHCGVCADHLTSITASDRTARLDKTVMKNVERVQM